VPSSVEKSNQNNARSYAESQTVGVARAPDRPAAKKITMADTPKTALELEIEQEAKELAEVPKLPVTYGSHKRCHICGQIYSEHDLAPYDQHTGQLRHACPHCHPARGFDG